MWSDTGERIGDPYLGPTEYDPNPTTSGETPTPPTGGRVTSSLTLHPLSQATVQRGGDVWIFVRTVHGRNPTLGMSSLGMSDYYIHALTEFLWGVVTTGVAESLPPPMPIVSTGKMKVL